jgi:FkbM family methyltransferase
MGSVAALRSWVSSTRSRELLRLALRPVPTTTLTRIAERGGSVGKIAGQGIRHRPATIAHGAAAGLEIDIGESNPAYSTGRNEQWVQTALCELLSPGDVFYDVGANVGFFSLLAARLVGHAGRVVAFEPAFDNVAVLGDNVRRNRAGNILISTQAASRTTGVELLWLADFAGGHSLVRSGDANERWASLVETSSLDDFAARGGTAPPDVVKIDVEGAEIAVLEGMSSMLARGGPTLIIEVDGPTSADHDARLAEIAHLLESFRYHMTNLADSYEGIDWVVSHWVCRRAAD